MEVSKKTVEEKNCEIEDKKKINKLMEDRTRIESTEDFMEHGIDIDNLLDANLGSVIFST